MPARPDLAAVVLAAGCSTRMEAFKPLLPFGSGTVIERVIAAVRGAGVEILRVVVGWQSELLVPVLERHGAPWVRNDRFDQGMYGSIQAGVGTLPAGVEAFFLIPGDMPLVRRGTLARLAAEWDRQPEGILHPCAEGRRGHPPLIGRAYIPEILREAPPGGLRTLLARHADEARNVECGDPGILTDLDTQEQYREALDADFSASC